MAKKPFTDKARDGINPMPRLLHFPILASLLLFPLPCSPQKITTVTITAAPTIPSAVPQFVDDDAFTSAILNSTNVYREAHNASSVVWNRTLASFAKDYLDSAACAFAHSGGPYGENLALGYANATASVEAWGDEGAKYNFGKPGFTEATGHFTQLVWKNTSDVGCGRRLCGAKGWYLVCEYWPRGNVVGAFAGEVDKPENSAARTRGGWLGLVAVGAVVLWIVS
ncbi:CAP domain-containing protein [Nemania serpens]|nr:CAP domain-containing protein [Nemania serpens]